MDTGDDAQHLIHMHDDTIIASSRALLNDRAIKLLIAARELVPAPDSDYPRASDIIEHYETMLKVSALCTYAASLTETALQAIADFEIRYGNGE